MGPLHIATICWKLLLIPRALVGAQTNRRRHSFRCGGMIAPVSKLASIAFWCVLVSPPHTLGGGLGAGPHAEGRLPRASDGDRRESRPEVVIAGHATREAAARRVGAGVIMPTNPDPGRPPAPITGGTIGDVGYRPSSSAVRGLRRPGARARGRARGPLARGARARAEPGARRRMDRLREVAGGRAADRSPASIGGDREADRQRIDAARRPRRERRHRAVARHERRGADRRPDRRHHPRARHPPHGAQDLLDFAADQPVELTTRSAIPSPPSRSTRSSRGPRGATRARRHAASDRAARRHRGAPPQGDVPACRRLRGRRRGAGQPIFGVVGLSVELPFAQRNAGPRVWCAPRATARRSGSTSFAAASREVTATLASTM